MAPLARLVAGTQCSKFGARLRNRLRADCAGPRSSASLRLLYQPSRSALHSLAGAWTFVRPLSGRSASGRARPRAPSRRETAPERLGRAPKLVPHFGRPRPLGPSPASAAAVGALTAFGARRSLELIFGSEASKGLGRRAPESGRRSRSRRPVDVLACPRSALGFSERRPFRLIFGMQGSNNY